VKMGLIDHIQVCGLKRPPQLFFDARLDRHDAATLLQSE
jgi:hypothetical protein